MLKRVFCLLLVFSMMVTLFPMFPMKAEAFGENNNSQTNFIFRDVATKVNYKFLTLKGQLNQVSPQGITYSVKSVSSNRETPETNRGISVSDDGTQITVTNIELFDGQNIITFSGKRGTADVKSVYEVEYISTPLLYNLQFIGGGGTLPLDATGRTIVTKDFTASGSFFTIEGNAPNVEKVLISNGTDTVSGNVDQDAEAHFIVSKIKLERGLNTLIFHLQNNNQTIEVKREVIYFDGNGTFYDVKMAYDTGEYQPLGAPLIQKVNSTDPNHNTEALRAGKSKFTGSVIIPNEPSSSFVPDDPTTPTVVDPSLSVVKVLHEVGASQYTIPDADITYKSFENKGKYLLYTFEYTGDKVQTPNTAFDMDQQVYVRFQAYNPVASYELASTKYDDLTSKSLSYKFLSSTTPEIEAVEYKVSGSTAYQPLIEGTILNEKPIAIKLKVRYGETSPNTDAISVEAINDFGSRGNVTISTVAVQTGTSDEYTFSITELPYDGSQTLIFYYNKTNNPTVFKTVKINSATGPVLKFEGLSDNLIFKYDPTLSNGSNGYGYRGSSSTIYLIEDTLASFKGHIENVVVEASDYNVNMKLQVNNNQVKLKQTPTKDANYFEIDTAENSVKVVSDMFRDGQNTVLFSFHKGNIKYDRKYIVTLYSNSVPEIPVANTNGIFPFNTSKGSIKHKDIEPDKRFTGTNGVFVTKEQEFYIGGTFDFIDLGKDESEVEDTIDDLPDDKYVFVVEGSNGFKKTWSLGKNELVNASDDQVFDTAKKAHVQDVTVWYDIDKKYFTFLIEKQQLPSDGSKVSFTFTVYNNGLNGGSRASASIEVSATGLSYKILRPVDTGLQSTINQNYLEVVIDAKNADKVVINKIEATKVEFDTDLDGDIDTADAWKAIVTDLKPGKKNTITFSITRGSDVVTDKFDVYYAPSTIPGAQFMTPMKNSIKVFENQVSLTFPKDTYLVRADNRVPQELRGQVFKEHKILFAIANSQDGVVDRYDYLVDRPRNFDKTVESLKGYFLNTFDSHFVKVSNVYWIDAGMADDPDTDEYDPYPNGMLPIMALPDQQQPELYNFNDVPSDRVLVPSKRATLELKFDANIVPDTANSLTVFRYNPDPNNLGWENIGGVVNVSAKTIKVPFDRFGYYVVGKMNDSFRDVVRHDYAKSHMEAMFAKGVILPRSSLDFGPGYETTRGEFAAMVVRALQIPLMDNFETLSFDDVIPDFTYRGGYNYRHIETAARLGIVKGTDPRIFNPEGKVTREEAAVILARALKLKINPTTPAALNTNLAKLFKDFNLIEPYAKPYVLAIAKLKLISGSPVDVSDPKKGFVFEPKANILRSDSAILMSRVMAYLKTIPGIQEVK
ncbi:S-layer homology domain-containing protein [Brevibacillus gelatini]|uniref:S-layer homology domain-containing protein n=1 Tax=Brevibacillus gelatini TaxID=1655277 RepID=UPI003D81354F